MLVQYKIEAAFQLGLVSTALSRHPALYGLHLDGIRASVNLFSDDIKPNEFTALHFALARLDNLHAALFRSPRAPISSLSSNPQAYAYVFEGPDSNPLADDWAIQTNQFGVLLTASLLFDCPYWAWFHCGTDLAECIRNATRKYFTDITSANSIEERVHDLQRGLVTLPHEFLAANSSLLAFCSFDGKKNHVRKWAASIPVEDDAVFDYRQVVDYESLFDCLYRDICQGIIEIEEKCPDVLAVESSQDSALDDDIAAGEETGGSEVLQLQWDSTADQLIIEGHKIEDCPREIKLRTGLDEHAFNRNAFIYTQSMLHVPYDKIKRHVAGKPEWEPLGTVPGVKAAAARFAKQFNLPLPPSRHPGRPKRKTGQ